MTTETEKKQIEQKDTVKETPIVDSYELFNPPAIKDGNYIMFKLPSENLRVHKLNQGTSVNLGKFGTFKANDIIGHPFGYTYDIVGERQLKIVSEQFEEDQVEELEDDENNQDLMDDPTAQTLSMQDIEALKKASTDGGREIIDKMVSSHSAFQKKTQFSQEKYIKRKEQKFLRRFTPLAIGTSELVQYYLEKDSHKVLDITEETLGLILSLANVRPGGTYLVVDDMSGLLVAALLERMQGEGLIVVAHESEHPNLDCLRYMNLTEEYIEDRVKSINWLEFFEPSEAETFSEKTPEQLFKMRPHQRRQYYRRKKRHDNFSLVHDLISGGRFDALVVGTELYLPTLVPKLIPSLGGSRPVVLYDPTKEHLTETSHVLQKDLRVLAPTMIETRVRKYQTLPGRFHPHMTMRGAGGYILWGTRVFPAENVNAVKVTRSRKRKADSDDNENPNTANLNNSNDVNKPKEKSVRIE